MVIANNGFQDHEFWITFQVLNNAWFNLTIAAWKRWDCVWVFWSKTIADEEIFFVEPEKYDMIVFIWWGWAYTQYFHDKDYLRLAKWAKKIWAICIAPMIVSESGVFNWKTVTWRDSWNVQKNFIESNWASWSDWPVVVCGNIVTWNWPDAAELFAQKCVELINNE